MSLYANLAQNSIFIHVILLIALLFIDSGTAIKCFICDSSLNSKCAALKRGHGIEPQVCTLEKMIESKSSYLYELYSIVIHQDTKLKQIEPPMNCQKVVIKHKDNGQLQTARFCQIHMRETDPCSIARRDEYTNFTIEHCSVCNTDKCNGTVMIHTNSGIQLIFLLYFGSFLLNKICGISLNSI